jgi:lambda family phage portal protein
LQSRSRDLVRNNPHAANIVDVLTANTIGTGIKPQSLAKNKEKIHKLWSDWTDVADFEGLLDFYGLQQLIMRNVVESGECFICFKLNRNQDVPLQLQVLESDFLKNESSTLPNGNSLVGGVELDKYGRRVAYHLYKHHPGELSLGNNEVVRLPKSEVLHVFKPLRSGQVRGEPWLSKILLKLHELDQYDDAELARKKTAAMFAGFITRLDTENMIMGEGSPNEEGQAFAGLEPGTMQILEPGEDVRFSQPSDVGQNYDVFIKHQLRTIAAGVGITYEQLTGDLSGVNYSSIRAGLVEFRRRVESVQHHLMVYQFCRPVWEKWFELAIIAGKLPLNSDKRVKWIPQGFDWVDPLKDTNSMVIAMQNGLKSRAEVVSGLGYDIEEIDKEIAADNKRAKGLGLVFGYQGFTNQYGVTVPEKAEDSNKNNDIDEENTE